MHSWNHSGESAGCQDALRFMARLRYLFLLSNDSIVMPFSCAVSRGLGLAGSANSFFTGAVMSDVSFVAPRHAGSHCARLRLQLCGKRFRSHQTSPSQCLTLFSPSSTFNLCKRSCPFVVVAPASIRWVSGTSTSSSSQHSFNTLLQRLPVHASSAVVSSRCLDPQSRWLAIDLTNHLGAPL